MKKERVSNVQSYHSIILQEVAERRRELTRKFTESTHNPPSRTNKQTTVKHKPSKAETVTSPRNLTPAPRFNINNLPYLADRAAENVRQWGIRSKINIDEVKARAAILKASIKPVTTAKRISYPAKRQQPTPTSSNPRQLGQQGKII